MGLWKKKQDDSHSAFLLRIIPLNMEEKWVHFPFQGVLSTRKQEVEFLPAKILLFIMERRKHRKGNLHLEQQWLFPGVTEASFKGCHTHTSLEDLHRWPLNNSGVRGTKPPCSQKSAYNFWPPPPSQTLTINSLLLAGSLMIT